ncbi:MAG: hypothetical protein AB7I09_18875 [Planctomycetota bacterium]
MSACSSVDTPAAYRTEVLHEANVLQGQPGWRFSLIRQCDGDSTELRWIVTDSSAMEFVLVNDSTWSFQKLGGVLDSGQVASMKTLPMQSPPVVASFHQEIDSPLPSSEQWGEFLGLARTKVENARASQAPAPTGSVDRDTASRIFRDWAD